MESERAPERAPIVVPYDDDYVPEEHAMPTHSIETEAHAADEAHGRRAMVEEPASPDGQSEVHDEENAQPPLSGKQCAVCAAPLSPENASKTQLKKAAGQGKCNGCVGK